ncbi:MAG: hemerythrin domain-containing protein [Planctomycetota bacterium]|nr:hemerythrin domain-containing protein [Planctomycetota bacterium]
MTDPFEVLEHEHRLISQVLEALEKAVDREMPADFYKRAVEFIEVYATRYHHAKEEDILYRYLMDHGMPRDYGPLGIVLEEHDYGDEYVERMRTQLADGDLPGVVETVREWVVLLKRHVETEEDLLLPMGRAMLTEEEIGEVAARFDEVPPPEPSLEHWEELGRGLESEVGAPA